MHEIVENEVDYDTDIPNAHDDSVYAPEELEAAYRRMIVEDKFVRWEAIRCLVNTIGAYDALNQALPSQQKEAL